MKAIRIFSKFRSLGLALLAVALSPCWAPAQSAASGEFRLPYEVHWARVVLSPGEYTFSVPSANLPCMLILKRESKDETPLMHSPGSWKRARSWSAPREFCSESSG